MLERATKPEVGWGERPGREALDAMAKLAEPDTKLVPGHGTIISRTDLLPYRDMIFAWQEKCSR
jgi:glyoxylase-like metal-dependent hydrolase (beta-lactamase superfamily II)